MAFFAPKGRNGFEKLERDFLRQDGIGTLLWQGTNPFGLAQLSLPSYERIDLLVDYLGETLFEGATFRDLLDSDVGTYLILNATDMTDGAVFPFTQSQFDLLCSDLAQTRLSEAVAASAAFPVALSPITLKNFSPCPAQQTATAWPPGWIESGLETVWYTNESRVRRARLAASYLNQTAEKNFVHLLDGGISDNLAVAEPFRLLTTFEVSPQFLTDISRGRIDRVVFVLINRDSPDGSSQSPKK